MTDKKYELKKYISLIILIFLFFPLPSYGDDTEEKEPSVRFEVDGYVKTLWTFFSSGKPDENFVLNTNRLRLDTRTFFGKKLALNLTYDLEAYTGSLVSTPLWDTIENPQSGSYWDLHSGTKLTSSFYVSHSLYRANLYYDPGPVRFDIGKQRIAWGVMRFFRPTDFFNPESPLQIEAGERTGIDALRIRTTLFGSSNKLEMVYAPALNSAKDKWAAKYGFYIGDYDVEIIGGNIDNMGIYGFTFDGYVGDGGLRGELLNINPPGENSYLLGTIGGDYTFSNKITLTCEYLYNGGGNLSSGENLLSFSGLLTTKNKHFMNVGISKEVTPLVTLNSFASYDIEGNSAAFFPSLVWNYKKNVDITIGVNFTGGSEGGDYTGIPDYTFCEIKYYF